MSLVSPVINFPPSQVILEKLKKDPMLANNKYDSILKIVAIFFDSASKTVNQVQKDFKTGLDSWINLELSKIQPHKQISLLGRIQSIVLKRFGQPVLRSSSPSSSSSSSSSSHQFSLRSGKLLGAFPTATIVPPSSSFNSSLVGDGLDFGSGIIEESTPSNVQYSKKSNLELPLDFGSGMIEERAPVGVQNSNSNNFELQVDDDFDRQFPTYEALKAHLAKNPSVSSDSGGLSDLSSIHQALPSAPYQQQVRSGSDEYEALFGGDPGAFGLQDSPSSSSTHVFYQGSDSSKNEGKGEPVAIDELDDEDGPL